MDELEEARNTALNTLADLYGENRITLREFEDQREQITGAATREELQRITGAMGPSRAAPPVSRATGGSVMCIMGDRQVEGDWLPEGALTTTCIMGDMTIDLRGCTVPDGAVLTTTTIMGDTVIRLPEGVRVRNEVTAILSDVKEKKRRPGGRTRSDSSPPAGEATGELILRGLAVMGDVRIRRE